MRGGKKKKKTEGDERKKTDRGRGRKGGEKKREIFLAFRLSEN